ncbi:response regulator transcription factor [Bradyrhizobium sp.]
MKKADVHGIPLICIVDDDGSVREATTALIRSLGYRAAAFESAEDFLSSDLPSDTSCLILDVQMPGMSGIELQRRLVAQGRAIPTVFVTAFPEERVQEFALNAGAIGFLSKPFYSESLIKCLDKALNGLNFNQSQDISDDQLAMPALMQT